MQDCCAECGAPLLHGDDCRENFHALLLLEGQVQGAPGSIIHFYTVTCYVLQHPDSMNYTLEALHSLRASLSDALDERVTLEDLRRRARYAADGAIRITRRPNEPTLSWKRGDWAMTVTDVCSVSPNEYGETVLRWAHSIREALATDQH